jgi:hypothetical protein
MHDAGGLMTRRLLAALASLALTFLPAAAQDVPAPSEHFGFEPGAHRRLADWDELTRFYEKIALASPRVTLDTLGLSTRGRPLVLLTVTSPGNHARLEELRGIQARLADPRTVSGDAERARLVEEGRTVVLLTHGVHALEVGSSQMAPRLAWRLATSDDPDVLEILDRVVLLQVPSLNPDGLQWIADWYERWRGTEHEAAPLPWLSHFYVGRDTNRDWYAFTQDETALVVREAHNRWHPHIVLDVHEMGPWGARMVLPPYVDPWEPNVDPALTAAVNQAGSWMAAVLASEGKEGVAVHAEYDAYAPGRAYSHYHGGARVLSETASARLATPLTVDPIRLPGLRRGYDAGTRTWNHPDPWEGGDWGLPDVVAYMESGAMALLQNAARNRRYWLETFHGIVERAVGGVPRGPAAWIVPSGQANETGVSYLLRVLTLGDVEVHRARTAFRADGIDFPAGSWVVPMEQPWSSFVQALLEVQRYPDLVATPGALPPRPYDVTAHTLGLLLGVETVAVGERPDVVLSPPLDEATVRFELPVTLDGDAAPRLALYKGWQEPVEAGWTRWLLDEYGVGYDTLHDADVRAGDLDDRYDVILLQSQDGASIVEGFRPGEVPPRWTGGIGRPGAEALRSFVLDGGRLVAVEAAAGFVIDLLDLPVHNVVAGRPETEFHIPGSILRLELDPASPLARGLDRESVAWFWRSSMAFRADSPSVRVAARYGSGDPLLSGWAVGGDEVAGEPALLEVEVGAGSVVLFGFQPNYRGQSVATWPLLFNALTP